MLHLRKFSLASLHYIISYQFEQLLTDKRRFLTSSEVGYEILEGENWLRVHQHFPQRANWFKFKNSQRIWILKSSFISQCNEYIQNLISQTQLVVCEFLFVKNRIFWFFSCSNISSSVWNLFILSDYKNKKIKKKSLKEIRWM